MGFELPVALKKFSILNQDQQPNECSHTYYQMKDSKNERTNYLCPSLTHSPEPGLCILSQPAERRVLSDIKALT